MPRRRQAFLLVKAEQALALRRAEQVEGDGQVQTGRNRACCRKLFVQQVEGQLVQTDAVTLRQADQPPHVQPHAERFEHQLVKGTLRVVAACKASGTHSPELSIQSKALSSATFS